jgi:hypothetical protein
MVRHDRSPQAGWERSDADQNISGADFFKAMQKNLFVWFYHFFCVSRRFFVAMQHPLQIVSTAEIRKANK